jgi:tetratricopeptide (TPR) repeat protein
VTAGASSGADAGPGGADAGTLLAELDRAAAALSDVAADIEAEGETAVERVAEAHDDLTGLLAEYESSATGTGREEFKSYVEFEAELEAFEEDLAADLPMREAFEEACDRLDRRRLDERDFERAREALDPATELADLLDQRAAARERYREARTRIERRIRDLDARIDDLEDVLAFAGVDFGADLDPIREPIESYNEGVTEAFRVFRSDAPAREMLDLLAASESYPLVSVPPVPDPVDAHLREHPVGTETVPTLLEYADYSLSKLQHYVDDPPAFRSAVAGNRTYFERLDAAPFRIDWPPPRASVLRREIGELVSVVGRFAPEGVVATLREVRDAAGDDRYADLREVAVARERLAESERRGLQSGDIEATRSELRERRERLREALADHPDP